VAASAAARAVYAARDDALRIARAPLNFHHVLGRKHAEADSLPDIPSTPEMATIENMIEQRRTKVTRILEELNAQGESESKGDPEKSDELTELLAQIESLKTKLINIDVLRRLEVGKAVASDAKIDEKSAKNNLFLSTGFFNLISGTTRVLAIISLALLAPSLVAISSSEIASATLQAQVRIHEIVLKSTAKAAENAWAQQLNRDEKEHELSDDDKKLIDNLTTIFSQYAIQVDQAIAPTSHHAGRALVQMAVRERIVRDFAASRGGAAPGRSPVVLESALAAGAERVTMPGGIGDSLRTELTQKARAATPEAWEAFKAKATSLARGASMPMSSEQLAPRLLSEVMNSAWKVASGGGESPHAFKMLAAELIDPGELTQRSREILRLNQNRFLLSIATTGTIPPIQEALRVAPNVPAHDAKSIADLREVSRKLAARLQATHAAFGDSPPTLTVQDRSGANLETARTRIEARLKTWAPPELQRGLPQTLSTYADYFPGTHGEELRTPRAKLVSATPALKSAYRQTSTETRTNFTRARSYSGLRGFAKVGGVLIGLGPSSHVNPQIVDMTWTSGSDGVRIILTRQDNKTLSFGPFRAEIIRLAMAYAADGRPVAVTMPADLNAGRKVMLHPALVDTALGCEARQLDQFVDKFTAHSPERAAAQARTDAHRLTYGFAWASRFKVLKRYPPDLNRRDSQKVNDGRAFVH
jgi:hypothetical protein